MSLNASGMFNLAVFGVILLAFTTEHQFQSVFGNNPIKKLSHNNFSVCLGTQPARSPADTSWSREVKLDREIEKSSSRCLWLQLGVPHGVIFTRRTGTLRSRFHVSHEQGLDPGLFVFSHPGTGISTHGCIGHGFGLQANVVEETCR